MLVVAAALGQLEPAATVAAATATRGFFILPPDAKRAADASRRAFAGDAASDHVATARAFEEWRSVPETGRERGARVLPRALLSRDALERVAEVREQLRSLLRTAGSRVASRPRARPLHRPLWTSRCSEPWRAPACSQKSPPCPDGAPRRAEDARGRPRGVPPRPVNAQPGASFPFPWVAYGEKVKTGAVYLRDSTCVPACACCCSAKRLGGGAARAGRRKRENENERRTRTRRRSDARGSNPRSRSRSKRRVRVRRAERDAGRDQAAPKRAGRDAPRKVENPAVDARARRGAGGGRCGR